MPHGGQNKPTHPLMLEARELWDAGAVPRAAYFAYHHQFRTAKRRGIPFLIHMADWWAWWQVDDRWASRGIGPGKMVMGRIGDVGPYALGNVVCITHSENCATADRSVSIAHTRARFATMTETERAAYHLAVKGEAHPTSRPVVTPLGRFGNVRLAAEAHGINPASASRKTKQPGSGWQYVEKTTKDAPVTYAP